MKETPNKVKMTYLNLVPNETAVQLIQFAALDDELTTQVTTPPPSLLSPLSPSSLSQKKQQQKNGFMQFTRIRLYEVKKNTVFRKVEFEFYLPGRVAIYLGGPPR